MHIYGRVADKAGGSIQGATIKVVGIGGTDTGLTAQSDAVGNFSINNANITLGQTVLFSHPSYYGTERDVPGTGSFGFVYLEKLPAEPAGDLEDIPQEPQQKAMPAWLWIVIVGGLLFAFSKDRKMSKQKR